MAKIQLNPMISGLSGKVGDVVFRRTASGKTIVSRAPAKSTAKPSESQNAHRQRFKQAVAGAKAALADPETRAYYEAAAAGSGKTAYNLALADCFRGKDNLPYARPQQGQNDAESPSENLAEE